MTAALSSTQKFIPILSIFIFLEIRRLEINRKDFTQCMLLAQMGFSCMKPLIERKKHKYKDSKSAKSYWQEHSLRMLLIAMLRDKSCLIIKAWMASTQSNASQRWNRRRNTHIIWKERRRYWDSSTPTFLRLNKIAIKKRSKYMISQTSFPFIMHLTNKFIKLKLKKMPFSSRSWTKMGDLPFTSSQKWNTISKYRIYWKEECSLKLRV